MKHNLVHLENDLRPLFEQIVERAQEGEKVAPHYMGDCCSFDHNESVGDLTEELLHRAMDIVKRWSAA